MKKIKNNSPIKATAGYLVCSFLQKAISIISVPIFTRTMATEQYGIFSVFSSWLTILTVFTSLNFGWEGIFNGFRDFKKDKERLINSVQIMSSLITASYLAISLMIPNLLEQIFSIDIFYIRLMLLQLSVSNAYDMWCAKQRYEFKYKKFCIITLLYTFLPIIVSLAAFALPNTENSASLRATVSSVASFAVAGALFLANAKNAHFKISPKYWRYALKLNLPLVPHYLSRTLLNQLDHVMVNKFCGNQDAGKYSLAYSIGLLPNMLTLAINNALSPWIYRMIEAKKIAKIRYIIKYIGATLFVGIVLMMLTAPELVYIFAPKEYYEAIYVIPSIAASTYAIYLYTILSDLEIYYASTKIVMFGSFVATMFNFISNYIFINLFGFIAAGYTTLASFYIILLVHFLQYKKITAKTDYDFVDKKFSIISMITLTAIALACPLLYSVFWLRISILLGILIILITNFKKIKSLTRTAIQNYKISQ